MTTQSSPKTAANKFYQMNVIRSVSYRLFIPKPCFSSKFYVHHHLTFSNLNSRLSCIIQQNGFNFHKCTHKNINCPI